MYSTYMQNAVFYSLFQAFPSIFFAIVGDTSVNVNAYEFVSVEIKDTAFRIDGVFVPTDETTEQPLYFVEVQFQLDSTFYRRFFAEIFPGLTHSDPPTPLKRGATALDGFPGSQASGVALEIPPFLRRASAVFSHS